LWNLFFFALTGKGGTIPSMDDGNVAHHIEALERMIAEESAAIRLLQELITNKSRQLGECERVYDDVTRLSTMLFGWIQRAATSVSCIWSHPRQPEVLSAYKDCMVTHWEDVLRGMEQVARCIASRGTSALCADAAAPWIGAALCSVLLWLVWKLIIFSTVNMTLLYRLKRVQRDAADAVPLRERLRVHERRMCDRSRFWSVIKAGIACTLFTLYVAFACSATFLLSFVLAILRLGRTDDDGTQASGMDTFWESLLQAPRHLLGNAVDNVLFLYALPLPLFVLVVGLMDWAVEDVTRTIPNVTKSRTPHQLPRRRSRRTIPALE
jgi:hypothetical protein